MSISFYKPLQEFNARRCLLCSHFISALLQLCWRSDKKIPAICKFLLVLANKTISLKINSSVVGVNTNLANCFSLQEGVEDSSVWPVWLACPHHRRCPPEALVSGLGSRSGSVRSPATELLAMLVLELFFWGGGIVIETEAAKMVLAHYSSRSLLRRRIRLQEADENSKKRSR